MDAKSKRRPLSDQKGVEDISMMLTKYDSLKS